VLALVSLLYKRSAPKRPLLEDRWLGQEQVPRRVREAVRAREAVLLADRALRKAKVRGAIGRGRGNKRGGL